MLPPGCPEAVTEAAPKEKGGGPLQKKARTRWVPPQRRAIPWDMGA